MDILNKDNYFDKSFHINFTYNILYVNRDFIHYKYSIGPKKNIILIINNNEIPLCDEDKIIRNIIQLNICDDTYKFENISFKEFQLILEYFLRSINGIKINPSVHDLVQKYKV